MNLSGGSWHSGGRNNSINKKNVTVTCGSLLSPGLRRARIYIGRCVVNGWRIPRSAIVEFCGIAGRIANHDRNRLLSVSSVSFLYATSFAAMHDASIADLCCHRGVQCYGITLGA